MCQSSRLPSKEFLCQHPELLAREVIIRTPGQSLSFETEGFQVDINVYTELNEFENSLMLLSLGGLGHMIGMALKEVGIKWNPKGLWLNGTSPLFLEPLPPLRLTPKRQEILDFLGLDEESWLKGFEKDTQAFEWICESKYTQLKTVHEKFKSFKKIDRDNVQRFVQHLVSTSKRTEDLDIKRFHLEIVERFGKDKEIQVIVRRQSRDRDFRLKYSGSIVSQLTGLGGKKLGLFIKYLKDSIPEGVTFQEFILDHVADLKEYLDQKLIEWRISQLKVES
jgi:hypothetical protein